MQKIESVGRQKMVVSENQPSTITPVGTVGPSSAVSKGRLRRQLSSFGVLLLTLSSLSPIASIYGVGSDVLQHAGTGAGILFLISVGVAAIWGAVYAELGSSYPYAGGDYVGVGAILGAWAALATLTIWAVTSGPSIAFCAEVISSYVAQLAPEIPVAAMTFGCLGAAVVIALLAVRMGALVTGVFLAIEFIVMVVLIVGGLWHPVRGFDAVVFHPVATAAGGALGSVPLAVMALAGVSAASATVGGNQAIYFGEELREPRRRIGRVIFTAALIGALATALPVMSVVVGARDLPAVLRSAAPLTAFIAQISGPSVARAIGASVALAMFNALVAQIMWAARLFFSLGRDNLFNKSLNRLLSAVDPKSGAPRGATLVVGGISAGCCALNSHTLLVFATGTLIYGWSLVCLAVWVGRIKGLTGQPGYWRSPLFPLAPALGLVVAAVFTIADIADAEAGRPSLIILGLLVLTGVLWNHFALRRRPGGWIPTFGRDE
jgi:amino acid transporter